MNTSDTGQRMRELAQELAPLLGKGWELDGERLDLTWAACMVGPDGERLQLSADRYQTPAGKVNIHAWMPDGSRDVVRYDERTTHEINVSESRGAAVIAREITRRLLPAYREQLADITERLDRQAKATEKRASVVEGLARDFRGSVASNGYRPDELRFGHGSRDYYGSVTVRHYADAVDLEIHGLPVDLARKVAAVLRRADA